MFIRRKLYLIITLMYMFISCMAGHGNDTAKFRIVGYYSLATAMRADLKTVPFDKLTHINLYFLNPDTTGNFQQDFSSLVPFITEAHRHHVSVLPSIAGGGPHTYYHDLLKDDKRPALINNLMQIVAKYNFDGIDVDIEGKDIDENYEPFAVELGEALHNDHKIITAAIAVFYKDVLSDKALSQYDFVNVMSYDHTGPWRPEKPGPHATYEQSVADIDYFATDRKIPKENMNLGLPFYGYGFGPALTSPATSLNYGQITNQFPNAHLSDSLVMTDGATLYYNGTGTVIKKVLLAKEKAGGVMIWQLSGDAADDKSLLSAINTAIH